MAVLNKKAHRLSVQCETKRFMCGATGTNNAQSFIVAIKRFIRLIDCCEIRRGSGLNQFRFLLYRRSQTKHSSSNTASTWLRGRYMAYSCMASVHRSSVFPKSTLTSTHSTDCIVRGASGRRQHRIPRNPRNPVQLGDDHNAPLSLVRNLGIYVDLNVSMTTNTKSTTVYA